MVDINVVIVNNIADKMKKCNTKQIDLANAIGAKKQDMIKMLNGSRMINIAELRKIADYFQVSADDLMQNPVTAYEENIVMTFLNKVNTDAAKEALRTVDELADMIIFHANVRDNAQLMSETWGM